MAAEISEIVTAGKRSLRAGGRGTQQPLSTIIRNIGLRENFGEPSKFGGKTTNINPLEALRNGHTLMISWAFPQYASRLLLSLDQY